MIRSKIHQRIVDALQNGALRTDQLPYDGTDIKGVLHRMQCNGLIAEAEFKHNNQKYWRLFQEGDVPKVRFPSEQAVYNGSRNKSGRKRSIRCSTCLRKCGQRIKDCQRHTRRKSDLW